MAEITYSDLHQDILHFARIYTETTRICTWTSLISGVDKQNDEITSYLSTIYL